jgi:2-polyprenyl-6-methoxyphenol hydroxylase-like FAD-dependent oxidoreductase
MTVTDVHLDDPDAIVVRYQSSEGVPGEARGRYLIDASGQRRFLAQRKRLVETHFDPQLRNMAVFGYFAGSQLLRGVDQTNFLLEAFPSGWAWHIPLHTGRASVGLVVGQDSLPELRAAGPDGFLAAQIQQTQVLRELVAPATQVEAARVINDGSYQVDRFSGDRFLLAGDAACFIDPMFAPGVLLALYSGLYAGVCLNFALSHPDRRSEVCALYEDEFARAYSYSRQAVLLSYSANDLFGDSPFWSKRKLSEEQLTTMAASSHFMHALQPGGALAYERKSLDYADLPPVIGDELDRIDRQRKERERLLREVMQDLGNWVPVWAPSIERRHQLGFPRLDQPLELVSGMVVVNDGIHQFVSEPLSVRAFEQVDGKTRVHDIVDRVLLTVPERERLMARFRVLQGFTEGFQRRLFDVAPSRALVGQPA